MLVKFDQTVSRWLKVQLMEIQLYITNIMWLFPIIWDGVLCMYIPASYKQVFNSVAVTFQIFLPQEPPSKVSKAQFLDE